jgi:hypothetical protein
MFHTNVVEKIKHTFCVQLCFSNNRAVYDVTRGGAVVEAPRYEPEGRGIDSLCCHWNISLT